MTGLAAHGIPVFAARAGIELTVLVTGWVLGGSVGIATVVFAASIGPLVQRAPPWLAVASPPAPSTHGRGRAPQRGFDRIGGRTEFVRGDMCDGPGLPAAYAACRAAPPRSRAAPIALPPAAPAWVIVTSPRTQARACSIA